MTYDSTDFSTLGERTDRLYRLLRGEAYPDAMARHLAQEAVLSWYVHTPLVVRYALRGFELPPLTLRDLIRPLEEPEPEPEARPKPNRHQRRAYEAQTRSIFKQLKKARR